MKGDFTRRIYDAQKHYLGVLHQQGRVWLDSDWNEEVFERLLQLQKETQDIVGRCGVPEPGTAFAITPGPAVSPGGSADFNIGGGAGNKGHAYVDGFLCELDTPVTYLTQPDLPDAAPITLPTDGSVVTGLVYLEVWHRLITFLQDDSIREPALGGPDTTTRIKTIAQVRFQALGLTRVPPSCPNMASVLPGEANGTLTVLQAAPTLPTDLCRLPDPGNYTGRENRLYRVEIHTTGTIGGLTGSKQPPAQFKWSRNNGSFAVGVTAVSADRLTLTVSSLGRDQATTLRAGDIVEISDDASELGPARGHLTTLSSDPDPDQLTVSIADALPLTFRAPGGSTTSPPGSPPPVTADRHLILRRWDGVGTPNTNFNSVQTPDMDLGDGVHIQFGGTSFRAGDYWQFAARTDGSLEPLTNAPPRGIKRHRCPLAIVSWSRSSTASPPTSPPGGGQYTMTVLHDCRVIFPPLAEPAVHVIGVFGVDANNRQVALANDTPVVVTALQNGFDVVCDAEVAPALISRAVCFLAVEIPSPFVSNANNPGGFYVPVNMMGDATASGNVISWRPRAPGELQQLPFASMPAADKGLLARIVIKGNYVWARDNPSMFLDGDTFGFNQVSLPTAIRLPSGDGRRGGTFETWFWLTPQPTAGPLTFSLVQLVPPVLRAEGITELLGEVVLIATGGIPAQPGVNVTPLNIQIQLTPQNVIVTSAPINQGADVVLRIDDPTTMNTGSFGKFPPPAIPGVGGNGVDYAGGAVANVFQGGGAGNTVTFTAIPIDAPGFGTRALRISNIRVNVSTLASPTGGPIPITATVSVNNQQFTTTVGIVQPGLALFELLTADNTPPPSPFVIPVSALNPSPAQSRINFIAHYREGFATAFKPQSQEVGQFTTPLIPQTGVATQGTQLRLTFTTIPPVNRLVFITMIDTAKPNLVKLVSVNGILNPPQVATTSNGVPLAQVQITPSTVTTGFAVFEWIDPGGANNLEDLRIGVVLVPAPNASGQVMNYTVTARLEPVAPVGTNLTAVPRFVDAGRSAAFQT